MVLVNETQVFIGGCVGGSLAELLHWWNLRTSDKLPAYIKSPFYWIVTFIMIIIGGAICTLQFGANTDAILAIQIGFGAPIFIQKLASAPNAGGSKGSREVSLKDFFRW